METADRQVLGALASVLSIWLVTGILVYEAVDRVRHPVRVDGKSEFPCATTTAPPLPLLDHQQS